MATKIENCCLITFNFTDDQKVIANSEEDRVIAPNDDADPSIKNDFLMILMDVITDIKNNKEICIYLIRNKEEK